MKILRKLVLLSITVGALYTLVGCGGYGETLTINNNNTLGTVQLSHNQNTSITEQEYIDMGIDIPKLENALNGYNDGYGRIIYENSLSTNVDPYLITTLIKFQTVDGTSYALDITNNLFGYVDMIDYSNNYYGDEILTKFNSKSESILYTLNKLRNTYTREYNLMSIEEIVDYLYPEWDRYKEFEDTKERYDRIVGMLYRDYEELRGEEYKMRGDN